MSNKIFGDWNPYAEKLDGDWLCGPKGTHWIHLGEVYINGVSMFEATSMDDLYKADVRLSGWQAFPDDEKELIPNPEQTKYRWYATVDNESTTIFCNFNELDPNENVIEINVRKACFYPEKNGLNYITVRGFEIAHAACPFTPPTSDQVGMVGPNWAKGWIIENYENADGTPIDFTKDFFQNKREENIIPGPFSKLSSGENKFIIWE